MYCKLVLILAALVFALGSMGCGREDGTAIPATTQAAAMATTAPAVAQFSIDGLPYQFQKPRVLIDRDSSSPRILVYSADETAAGSFYFEVPLEADASFGEGQVVSWEQQLQFSEIQESPIGINPPHNKDVLQPQSMRIEVRFLARQFAEVSIQGDFLMFTGEAANNRGKFPVSAQFIAAVED